MITSVSCARFKQPENVFDQLYYEVKTVKNGEDSVIMTGTPGVEIIYEMGIFQSIWIPTLDMSLRFNEDSLYILFYNHIEPVGWNMSKSILYRYDIRDKKLYGERDIDYLKENFLSQFFEWSDSSEESSAYSLKYLGDYTFTLQEMVSY